MKQGNVTIDINDYDKMKEQCDMTKFFIDKDGNDIYIRFNLLSLDAIKYMKDNYPGYEPVYYSSSLEMKFNKKDSNA